MIRMENSQENENILPVQINWVGDLEYARGNGDWVNCFGFGQILRKIDQHFFFYQMWHVREREN